MKLGRLIQIRIQKHIGDTWDVLRIDKESLISSKSNDEVWNNIREFIDNNIINLNEIR